MIGLRSILGSMFLITATFLGQAGSPSPVPAGATEEPAPCKLGSLPSDIQSHLKGNFGTWKVQEAETLSEHAREDLGGEKTDSMSRNRRRTIPEREGPLLRCAACPG